MISLNVNGDSGTIKARGKSKTRKAGGGLCLLGYGSAPVKLLTPGAHQRNCPFAL